MVQYSQETTRMLLESIPEALFVTSPEGKYIDVNNVACRLLGYERSELLALTMMDVTPPHLYSEYAMKFAELKEKGRIFDEIVFKRKDGAELDAEIYGTVLTDGNYLGTVREITQRKEMERKLKESEETYRNLVEMSPDAIVVHCEGKITFINQAGASLYGVKDAQDMIGKDAMSFVHPDFRLLAKKRIAEILKNRESAPFVYEKLFRADGSLAHVEIAASPFRLDDNSIQVVVRDITERLEMQEKLEEKNNQLKDQLFFSKALNRLAEAIIRGNHSGNTLETITKIIGETLDIDCCLIIDSMCFSIDKSNVDLYKKIVKNGERNLVHVSHKDDINTFLAPQGMGKALHQGLNIHSFYWYPFSYEQGGSGCLALYQMEKMRTLTEKELSFLMDAVKMVEIAVLNNKSLNNLKITVKALQESKEKYKELFQNANDIIYTTDLEGNFLSVNNVGVKTFGYDRNEMMRCKLLDIVHPSFVEKCLDNFQQKLIGSKHMTGPYEVMTVTKDGKKIWVEVSTRLIKKNQVPIGLQGIARDITERKQMIEAITKAEQEKDLILSSISEIVIFHDLEMKVRWANSMASETQNIPIDQIIGRHCYEIWHNTSFCCEDCPVRKTLDTGETESGEIITSDGVTWQIKSFPVVDEDNKVIGAVEIAKDITERKRMEIEMARFDRLNLIGEMASGFGHEIRNPITVVKGFLQFLYNKNDLGSYRDHFEIMIEEMDRANSIITEYLSLAKNKVINLRIQSLNQIIESLYPLILGDALHDDKFIEIELKDIPFLMIDKNDINQLILNLVRNGLEAMTKGGILTIMTYPDDKEVVLAIKDQGKGIEPSILSKLGMPFITTKENGTGIGLAICYSIADRNKAHIGFETSISGTTFYIRFPALQSAVAG